MATETPKILKVRFDRVYGKLACYPANAAAEVITALTKKKTLDPRDLELARELGFEIVVTPGSAAVLNEFFNKDVIATCERELADTMLDPGGHLRAKGLLYVEGGA